MGTTLEADRVGSMDKLLRSLFMLLMVVNIASGDMNPLQVDQLLAENARLEREIAMLRKTGATKPDLMTDLRDGSYDRSSRDFVERPVDPKNILSEGTLKKILNSVVFLPEFDIPTWEINGNGLTNGKEHGPRVSCPCTVNGTPLTRDEGLRRILGAIDDIGVTRSIANKVSRGSSNGGAYVQKLALASIKMFKCWEQKCAAGVSDDAIAIEAQLDDLLESSEAESASSGWNSC